MKDHGHDWLLEELIKAYSEDKERRRKLYQELKREFEPNTKPTKITDCF